LDLAEKEFEKFNKKQIALSDNKEIQVLESNLKKLGKKK